MFFILTAQRARQAVAAALLIGHALAAHAGAGLAELPPPPGSGPVTVLYPSTAAAQPVQRGPFRFEAAERGAPAPGNGRLVVLSHGSGGSPWPQLDLAQALVAAGYTVAMPEHAGDNWHDHSKLGPESWALRPKEVSQAIDAVAADARLARLKLDLQRVGMYGMSAGGITALTLAGARWSPALLARHCAAHLREDFATCVGLSAELTGGALDEVKLAVAKPIIERNFGADTAWRSWNEPRIAAVVAAVPMAVPIDLASLTPPRVPLGLVRAGQDAWLVPRFHIDAVRAACEPSRLPGGESSCTLLADLARGGHGSILSPHPPELPPRAARLLNDPPGFDPAERPRAYAAIVAFFDRQLRAAAPGAPAAARQP